jgi:uncharacterized protein
MYPKHAEDGSLVRVVNCRSGAILGDRVALAVGVGSRLRGLLGRSGLSPGEGLWLEPCSSIHMFFMRFAIDVLFVDSGGAVVKRCVEIRPWRVAAGGISARAALELPVGVVERSETQIGDRLAIEAR